MSPDAVAYLSLGLRQILGWIFLASSADKLFNLKAFEQDLSQYPATRQSLVRPASILIPAIELLLALNLLLGLYWRFAAIGAAALLLVFSAAVAVAIARGHRGSCGCGGLVPTKSLSFLHLIANTVMLASASVLALLDKTSATVPLPSNGAFLEQTSRGLDPGSLLVITGTLMGLLALASLAGLGDLRSQVKAKDAAAIHT